MCYNQRVPLGISYIYLYKNTVCHSLVLQPVAGAHQKCILFFVMQLITNKRGKIVCSDTHHHDVPQVTSGILLDYIDKKGLRSTFAGCLDGAIQPGVLDCAEGCSCDQPGQTVTTVEKTLGGGYVAACQRRKKT
jgi:hypothetical protein